LLFETQNRFIVHCGFQKVKKAQGHIFNIIDIADNGTVKIQELDIGGRPKGTVITKDGMSFAGSFRLSGVVFDEIDWRPIYAKDNIEFDTAFYKNVVVTAIGYLLSDVDIPSLIVMAKPPGVFASAKYKKGELVLVPATTKMVCKPDSATESMFDVRGDASPDNYIMELQNSNSRSCMAPAWMVKHNKACEHQNMEIVHKQVHVQIGRPNCKKADLDNYTVHIPCLVNSKEVKANDELFLPQMKHKREATTQLVVQPASRPRKV